MHNSPAIGRNTNIGYSMDEIVWDGENRGSSFDALTDKLAADGATSVMIVDRPVFKLDGSHEIVTANVVNGELALVHDENINISSSQIKFSNYKALAEDKYAQDESAFLREAISRRDAATSAETIFDIAEDCIEIQLTNLLPEQGILKGKSANHIFTIHEKGTGDTRCFEVCYHRFREGVTPDRCVILEYHTLAFVKYAE